VAVGLYQHFVKRHTELRRLIPSLVGVATARRGHPIVRVARVWAYGRTAVDELGGMLRRAYEVRTRTMQDFHDAVVKLLTDKSAGTLAAEWSTEGSGSTITVLPSDEVLLQEIQRLRDVATGSPKQAERAELRSVRQDLDRMRQQRDSMTRAWAQLHEVQRELIDALDVRREAPGADGRESALHGPTYAAMVAEAAGSKPSTPEHPRDHD
jgi:hypothetical protein